MYTKYYKALVNDEYAIHSNPLDIILRLLHQLVLGND